MKKLALKACLLLGVLAVSAGGAEASVYDAVNDFSGTNGGSNPWSYDFNTTSSFASKTALDQYIAPVSTLNASLNAWHNTGGTCCNTAHNSVLIGKNTSSGPISYETIVQPNTYLEVDPEGNQSADVVFTAPTAGSYAVSFSFLGIDTQAGFNNATHPVDVLVNGVGNASLDGSIAAYNDQYKGSFTTFLAAGQTLDFQTLTSPNTFAYLSTGVSATISTVPLPASLPMFGGALLALAGFGYGLNRWVAPKSGSAVANG